MATAPSQPAIKRIFKAQLGNALATLFTADTFPANGFIQCTSLWVVNTDTVARAVTLRIGTGTTTASDSLLEAVSIDPKTAWFFSTGDASVFLILAGEVVQGLCDVAAKVNVVAYGQFTTQ